MSVRTGRLEIYLSSNGPDQTTAPSGALHYRFSFDLTRPLEKTHHRVFRATASPDTTTTPRPHRRGHQFLLPVFPA